MKARWRQTLGYEEAKEEEDLLDHLAGVYMGPVSTSFLSQKVCWGGRNPALQDRGLARPDILYVCFERVERLSERRFQNT